MCLNIKKSVEPFIAEDDIVCYKFLVRKEGCDDFLSPYHLTPYKVGEN